MNKRMLVNAAQEGEVRVGVIEKNILEDLNVAFDGNELLKGNLYKARVVSVESGLQAAFVDYGAERNGFITFNDIHPRYYNKKSKSEGRKRRIQDAITPGAELLVQVYKEEVGNKGAAMTTDITLPGRYLVLMPFSDSAGVSRKIENEAARKKIKELIAKLNIPDDIGLIVRTAGQGRTKTELQKDYQNLIRIWGHSQARFEQSRHPGLIYQEPDVVIRSVRDYFTDDVNEIVVDDESVMSRLVEYFEKHDEDIVPRVKRYKGKMPLFSNYGLERQLENITSPKVGLPSGGSIVVNPTEALTAIDVNSGKSRGQSNQEEMAYQTNLEAAEEAARQLRLRDLGGLVVIDFIDMYENKNRRGVEKALKQAMKRDKARVEVGRISRFGLLELSRQRVKARLLSSTHKVCPMCEGSGYVMSTDVASMTMLRRLQELAVSAPHKAKIRGQLPVNVALKLLNEHRQSIAQLEHDFNVSIEIVPEIGAVSTREAFTILAPGATEKPKEERKDRRDRRDRRDRGRKRSSGSSSNSQNQHRPNQATASDEPYEPPRVIGFIEPDALKTADLGPADEDDDTVNLAADSTQDEQDGSGRDKDRGRRRRRRRRGQGEERSTRDETQSSESASSQEEDPASRRRREARERNRARRDARAKRRTEKPEAIEAAPENKKVESGEKSRAKTSENRRDMKAASRLAAKKLLDRAQKSETKNEEEKAPKANRRGPVNKAEAPKRARSSSSRIADKLKGRAAARTPAADEPKKADKSAAKERSSRRNEAKDVRSLAAAKLKGKAQDAAKKGSEQVGGGSADQLSATPKKSERKVSEERAKPARSRNAKTSVADKLKAKVQASVQSTRSDDKPKATTEKASVKSGGTQGRSTNKMAEKLKAKLSGGATTGSSAEKKDAPKRTRRTTKSESSSSTKTTTRTGKASAKTTKTKTTATKATAAAKAKKVSDDSKTTTKTAKRASTKPAAKSGESSTEKVKSSTRTTAKKAATAKSSPKKATTTQSKADSEDKPKRTRKSAAATAEKTPTGRRSTAKKTTKSDEDKPKRTRSTTRKTASTSTAKSTKAKATQKTTEDASETAKRTRKSTAATAAKTTRTKAATTSKVQAESNADVEKPKRTRRASTKAGTTKTTTAKSRTTKATTAKATKAKATTAKARTTKAKSAASKTTAKVKKALAKKTSTDEKSDLAKEKAASVLATLSQ